MSDKEFWCPTLIESWRDFLRRGVSDDKTLTHRHAFLSNIGYNLQYLQFLAYQVDEVPLHSTVYIQTLKSFVITGMGIVEALAWYLLKRSDLQKKNHWGKVTELKTNTFKDEETEYRVINFIEKKLEEPVDVEASLQWMIRRVENKKMLGMDEQVYKDLNYLRSLRNKIHIHVVQHDTDTDWNAFNNNEYKLMKKALYGVFTSDLFRPEEKHLNWLDFLHVEESTDKLIEEIPF